MFLSFLHMFFFSLYLWVVFSLLHGVQAYGRGVRESDNLTIQCNIEKVDFKVSCTFFQIGLIA